MNTGVLPFVRLRHAQCETKTQKRILRIADVLKKVRFYVVFLLLLPTGLLAQDRLVGLTSDKGPNGAGTAFSILSNGTGFTIQTAFLKGGYSPYGDLVKGSDGNFYGTTTYGGTVGYGTIFKVTPTGTISILKNMDYYTSGGYPRGNLIRGTDGNFYGMAYYGGTGGYGTIFKITPSGTFTTLVNLNGTATGAYPYGSLVQASDGNFYGMTYQGGSNNYGTIFKMTSGGIFTVLKHLSIGTTGGYPEGNLVQGADGALYGMTSQKTSYYGTIFKITTSGTLSVLKNFDYSTMGGQPHGSLIKAADGYFYGMTYYGGASGYGTIFRITSGGTLTVIKKLDYTNTGGYPEGSLVQGTDKLLYGMTSRGGTNGYGTIFKVATSGGSFTVLRHLASGSTSYYPYGSLVQGSDGAFYGMSYYGGNTSNSGTVFKITSTGTYTLLASLPDGGRGINPHESLIQGTDGYFYGTAKYGGANNHGTIFKLCTDGSFKTVRALNYSTTGGYPEGSLVQGTDGNFYGMTYQGGTSGYGTIIKITPSGTLTVLKNLTGGAYSGGYPYGSLVQGNDGAFYGMTYYGGANNYGIIFKITSTGTFTIIKDLSYATTGAYPYGSLIKGTDGNFYGMTYQGGAKGYGTIFKITPSGTLTVLKNFDYSITGGYPRGNLLQNTDGNFYGMAYYGGTKGYGTIFKLTPTGTLTVLKNLDATTGGYPEGSLVRGTDGTLYGLTSIGGTYGSSSTGGTIFKITTGGTFTVLRNLKPATDGSNPFGSLVIQKANPKAVAQSVTTAEDVAKTITLSGTGGTPLTYTIFTAPQNGTLTGSGATRTYTPKANFNGKDSFYFKVTWGCQISTAAKVLITVTQVNDAPVLAHIGNKSVVKGSTLTFTATATDVDAGQTKKFSLIGAPSGATIGASSGVFSWTPTVAGTYVFKVRVTDNGSPILYDEEAITVTVTSSALTSITKAEKVNTESVQGLSLTAMPNPSSSYFTLQLKSNRAEAVTLKVTDALGRMIDVKTGLSPNGTVQLGHTYLAGTYMVQAQQGTKSTSVKLLKQ